MVTRLSIEERLVRASYWLAKRGTTSVDFFLNKNHSEELAHDLPKVPRRLVGPFSYLNLWYWGGE